jgi:hypothetical protein
MPEQARLDMLQAQRFGEQGVIVEIDLPNGKIISSPPVGVDLLEFVGGQWILRKDNWLTRDCCLHAWLRGRFPSPMMTLSEDDMMTFLKGGLWRPHLNDGASSTQI